MSELSILDSIMGENRPTYQSLLVEYEPETLAASVLKKSDQTNPPTDLFRVLKDLGIRAYDENLKSDGYLLKDSGGGIIFYKGPRHQEGYRWRFTIAHEIGHWVLKQLTISGRKSKPASLESIEVWCNKFASELLIQESVLRGLFQKENLTYPKLLELAELFQVSEDVLRYRLRSQNVEIVLVERDGGKLVLVQNGENKSHISLSFIESAAGRNKTLAEEIAKIDDPIMVGPEMVISLKRKIVRYYLIKPVK